MGDFLCSFDAIGLTKWPDFFDIPLRDSYGYTPEDRRGKTDMELGGRYRIRFATDETALNCYFWLSHEQLTLFESFEHHYLEQGSKWFEMPLLSGGAITHHVVRFKERPRMEGFAGGYAKIKIALDVKARNIDRALVENIRKDKAIAWPEALGLPLRDSYAYSPVERRAIPDIGISGKIRKVYNTDETSLECVFAFDKEQIALFESFEKYVLHQGAAWFEMPLLTGGALENHTVRLRERPSFSEFVNGGAMVSLQLDVKNRKLLDEGLIWLVFTFGGYEQFEYFEDTLQAIVNEKFPASLPYPYKQLPGNMWRAV